MVVGADVMEVLMGEDMDMGVGRQQLRSKRLIRLPNKINLPV